MPVFVVFSDILSCYRFSEILPKRILIASARNTGDRSYSTLTTLRALGYSQLRLICEQIVEFRDFR